MRSNDSSPNNGVIAVDADLLGQQMSLSVPGSVIASAISLMI